VPLQLTGEREKVEKQSSVKALCLYYDIYFFVIYNSGLFKTPYKGDPRPTGCLLPSSTNKGKHSDEFKKLGTNQNHICCKLFFLLLLSTHSEETNDHGLNSNYIFFHKGFPYQNIHTYVCPHDFLFASQINSFSSTFLTGHVSKPIIFPKPLCISFSFSTSF